MDTQPNAAPHTPESLLNAALLLADAGLPTAPMVQNGVGPYYAGGWDSATTDVDSIERNENWHDAVAAGVILDAANLIVLDADDTDALAELLRLCDVETVAELAEQTFVVQSARGPHVWFRRPECLKGERGNLVWADGRPDSGLSPHLDVICGAAKALDGKKTWLSQPYGIAECPPKLVAALEALMTARCERREADVREAAERQKLLERQMADHKPGPREDARFRAYADRARDDELSTLAGLVDGQGRRDGLFKAACALGRLMGAPWAPLSAAEAELGLRQAAETNGTLADHGLRVIDHNIFKGLATGEADPRPMPDEKPLPVNGSKPPSNWYDGSADELVGEDGGQLGQEDGTKPVRDATKSLFDTMQKEFPAPQWAIEGLVPAGLTLLAGKAKTGKSWMLLDIILAVAAGTPALQGFETELGDVLMLAMEDSEPHLQGRVRQVLGDRAVEGTIDVVYAEDLIHWRGADCLDNVERWLKAHPNAKMVVIDTFKKVEVPQRGNLDAYTTSYESAIPWHALANKYGVAIVLVMHMRKVSAGDDWVDDIMGGSGYAGAADTIMNLYRERNGSDGVLRMTSRKVRECELAVAFDSSTGRWRYTGDPVTHRLQLAHRAVVEAALDLEATPAGSPARLSALVDAVIERQSGMLAAFTLRPGELSQNPETIRTRIRRMVSDGLLDSPYRGFYQLSQKGGRAASDLSRAGV